LRGGSVETKISQLTGVLNASTVSSRRDAQWVSDAELQDYAVEHHRAIARLSLKRSFLGRLGDGIAPARQKCPKLVSSINVGSLDQR